MALFDSGTPVANVALSDTFNTWRIRTNQINTQAAGLASNNTFTGALNTFSNAVAVNGPVTAPVVTANSLAGTMATAAQPNITSVGTLTTLSVTGTAGFDGHVTAPSITANTFNGDGSGLTGLSAGLDWSATTSTSPHYMLIASNTSGSGIDQFNIVSGITIHPGSGRITANTFIGDGAGLTNTGATVATGTADADLFIPFTGIGSGTMITANVNSSFTFNPSTGQANATDFNSTSDERLKTNIVPISNAVDKVMALEGVYFDWIENNTKSMGLIAQQTEQILPEVVSTDTKGYKSISYGKLIGLLIQAIKEQQEDINKLKG